MSKNIMQMCADEIAGYLKRIAELEKQLKDFCEKWEWLDLEDADKTLTESEQKIWEIMEKNQDLEKQLAEKDKLINDYADEHAMLQYKIADLAVKEIKAEDFAIEQLEKVKYEFFDISNGWWLCFRDGTQYMTHRELEGCMREVIDKQIKQLKEME